MIKHCLIKFKKWLIGIGIIGVASAMIIGFYGSSPTLTEVPIIQTQTGEKYVHKFQDQTTGKIFEIETTKLEYDKLTLKGAKQPSYPNAKWLSSAGGAPIYSTSTPILKDYEFFIMEGTATGTGKALIKLPNEPEKIIDTSLLKTMK